MRIDSPLMTNAVATGSFTGSFTGEFIGNIQADSVAYENITGKPTLVSGSDQIDITQTTGYTSFSSSIANDIAGLDGEYATDAELNASSSALITAYGNADTTLSASLAADIATNASDIDTLEGKTLFSGSIQVDHDATTNFVANEHVDHSGVSITAGSGLTGGGDITTTRTVNVGQGTGITVGANDISTNDSEIVHDNLSGFVANEHIDHSSITLTAGDGLSGGGDITTSRTFAVDATVLRTTGDGIISSSAQVDHDQTTNYDPNEHFTQANITTVGTVTSGDVSAILPNGVISGSDQVTLSSVSGYVANENIDHSTVSITAGSGLTGGGDITSTRTINVGAGTGVTVNANDVAIGQDVATTANVTFGSVSVTNDVTISGDLTVLGDATQLQVSALNIEDINITVASGSTTSAQADGAGITIAGANESLTWDHGNSRFNFSDDLNVAGNITVSGTVDGVDILALSNTVGGIDTSVPAIIDSSGTPAFNTGITKAEVLSILNVEDGATADQSAAEIRTLVESATDSNVFTDADHSKLNGIESGATADQSDAEIETAYNNRVAQVSSAERTAGTSTTIKRFAPADIKSMIDTHQTDTVYTHPTHPGDDISIDTGALTGATVISDLDFNVTTDTLGHVTDANATVSTRNLTKGDIGLGNVENTALSTWAGSSNITTLGTIGTGTWNGSVIASAYLDADTAHLSGGQTFSGQKTFTSPVDIRNTSLNIENSGGSAVSTLSHNGTHTKIESHLGGIILDNMGTSGGTLQVTGSIDTDSQATFGGTLRVKATGLFGNSSNYYAKIQGNTTNGAEILGSTNGTFVANTGIAIAGSTVTVRSTLRATGDVVAYYSSDERLKDNIEEIGGALDKVEALRGVSFDWNDKQDVYEGHDIGVIAQEVETVLPELVDTRDNGYKAVKYEKLTAVLIQAVKELSARVKELENK